MSRAVVKKLEAPVLFREPASSSLGELPPEGASPATDLQRTLAKAALHGFYVPKSQSAWGGTRRLAVMIFAAVLSWLVVFGPWLMIAAL